MKDKTYYDLTKEEKKKYEKEFSKTSLGKVVYNIATAVQIFTLLMEVFFVVLLFVDSSILLEDPKFMLIYIFMLIVISVINWIPCVYLNINFSCWLKNKYGINRW